MGRQENQSFVSIIGSVLVIGFYSLYVYSNYIQTDPEILNNYQFWGRSFLYLIPVGIIVQIMIQILFAIGNKLITREDMPEINDERDKLIEPKSIRISHWIFIIGFMLAMGSLAAGMQPFVMFLTLISSGFLGNPGSELQRFSTTGKEYNMYNEKALISNSISRLRFFASEMTQQKLADRTGVTRQTIVAIENGKYFPSLKLAFRIAYVFNAQLSDVFAYYPEHDPVLEKLKAKQAKNEKP